MKDTLAASRHPKTRYAVEIRSAIADDDEVAIEYSTKRISRRSDNEYWAEFLVRFSIRDGIIQSVRPYFDLQFLDHLQNASPNETAITDGPRWVQGKKYA